MSSYKLKNSTSIHEAASYLGRGADLHPHLSNWYTDELIRLERLEQLCLVPSMILHVYHRRLLKAG